MCQILYDRSRSGPTIEAHLQYSWLNLSTQLGDNHSCVLVNVFHFLLVLLIGRILNHLWHAYS